MKKWSRRKQRKLENGLGPFRSLISMPEKQKTKPPSKGRSPVRGERESAAKAKRLSALSNLFNPDRLRWLILVALSLIIAFCLFPNILTNPKTYRLGDVAEKDIKASHDFLIENKALTEKNREKAAKEALSVYDFDSSASNLVPRIKEAFNLGRESLDPAFQLGHPEQTAPSSGEKGAETLERDNSIKKRFFALLDTPVDEKSYDRLVTHGFPAQVEAAVIQLTDSVFQKGVVGSRNMLMNQVEKGGIILHEIYAQTESKVTDFDRFYDLEGAVSFIRSQKKALMEAMNPPELVDISIGLAQSLIKPNLTFNQRETELRKDLARKSVKPTYFQIKKGEMLVREGERLGPDHLLRLSADTISGKRVDLIGRIPAMAILIGLLFSVLYLVGLGGAKPMGEDSRDLLFNAVTLLTTFLFIWAYNFTAEEVARGFHAFTSRAFLFAMPVACGAMLISIFQGINVAIVFSLVISVLASLITGGRVEFFVYFFISSLVAAFGVRHCSERVILIKTGLKVGLIQIVLSLSIEMIYGSLYSTEALIASAFGFLGGFLMGIIATGILPLIEMSFGFTTDIKLLELGNLDQPLLRELMVQAPGTYHHSVIISNMVEATAKAVDANPLLAKVSAYYHDIGKMKKPLYFIENQMWGENRHEKLAPSMSSLILISHTKDGVDLAKKNKLGKEITDIIHQHHGTSLITYFYQKAKERVVAKGKKSAEVEEENFRYPGPKPQTKEAGLVMLADMVEAASRSLVDPTPSRIKGMVQKIMNKAFSDGQLDECELTLKDLNEIAKSFNKTLSGIFHQRIEYPEVAVAASKKGIDGSTDQTSAEDSGAKKPDDKEKAGEGLKRLGLS
jgi:putative nucleotidyltransferase with HDIG domain